MLALMPIRISALAGPSSAAGTVWLVSAADAGRAIADNAPLTTLSAISTGIDAQPESTPAATTACTSAAARLEQPSTTWRGSRSASTPPNSSTATLATERAPTTMPRSTWEPVRSSTAKASTIGARLLARRVAVLPTASQRKSGWRSGASSAARLAVPVTPNPRRSRRSRAVRSGPW